MQLCLMELLAKKFAATVILIEADGGTMVL
jgi:hypothetical protein